LKALNRSNDENVKHLRKEKLIPAIVYWKKQEPISVKIDYTEFLKLFRIAWETHIVNLDIEWNKIDVLIYEIVKDPVKWEYQHIDFYAITKWEKITTNIPLSFIGSSKSTVEWAIIEEHIKEIEVKLLPTDLVDFIEVNLEKLENIWDIIRISDLVIDREKFEILENPDDVVVAAIMPKEEKIEEEIVPIEWTEAMLVEWDATKEVEEKNKEK
jgi:large subunit ribosomal protein L25